MSLPNPKNSLIPVCPNVCAMCTHLRDFGLSGYCCNLDPSIYKSDEELTDLYLQVCDLFVSKT